MSHADSELDPKSLNKDIQLDANHNINANKYKRSSLLPISPDTTIIIDQNLSLCGIGNDISNSEDKGLNTPTKNKSNKQTKQIKNLSTYEHNSTNF